ncbi:MAG: MarR family transcriptional regulator [Planctomycetes bacterium]|nr:MarR family transcriptional regulator [Planctomycetota bacterium]
MTSLRAAGYRVLFAILAKPALLAATVREIESECGASRQAVSELLVRLRSEGAVTRTGRSEHRLVPGRRGELVARFAGGWSDVLAPALTVGRFRGRAEAGVANDASIERTLRRLDVTWGFGGTAGAMRLAPHYRGADTVLHVAAWSDELQRVLGLVPDRAGPVAIYRTMGGLDLATEVAHCAHPLLVHAELLTSGDDRAREAARVIRDRFLRDEG